jgi:predicted protein tyrosine phosphatase
VLIQACSHEAAGCRLRCHGPVPLILITDPGEVSEAIRGIERVAADRLHLKFHDLDQPFRDARIPDRRDVERALEWSRGRRALIVSCTAGISRSPALAYVLRCAAMAPAEAARALDERSHFPNPRIIELGAELLADPRILEVAEDWSRTRRARFRESWSRELFG